jgi:glutaryl-CoA dehydrogenase (non-decarboxylating)
VATPVYAAAHEETGARLGLTRLQEERRAAVRAFVVQRVAPGADAWDRDQRLPPDVIAAVAERGWFGAGLGEEWGGLGWDAVSSGLLHEELGRGCASLRSLLTVHAMVCHAIARWGTGEQRARWLPRLAAGELLCGFALTESAVGSDAKSVATTVTETPAGPVLAGEKRWVTGGQIADVLLVLARSGAGPTAYLVETDREGVERTPVRDLLGMRASMAADYRFASCVLDGAARLGREAFGFSHVFAHALDLGRYTVAWGCVGLGQACLDACSTYVREREQFGAPLMEHPLVQALVTDMIVGVQAARLLCLSAGQQRDRRDPGALVKTMMAKYLASKVAARSASDAVQIHGANGCGPAYPVQRHYRDAKILEIIEGSSQILQMVIARHSG